MRSSDSFQKKIFKLIGIFILIFLPAGLMTWKIMSTETLECEVCMEFRGKSKCRKAQGPSREECQQTATDNACAFLASGMTDSIQCTQRQPLSVKF